ncbi:MAG: site-specific integrase [Xenococcaceae cyanobacterium MO_188.B19]|nr:site-specific integrase [Xenococcaceae cyanobacterium MO_188.B19]
MSILPDWNSEADKWLIARNVEAKELLSNPLLQKDSWRTIEDLGLKVNQHNKKLAISFKKIEQYWLKVLAKLYILMKSKRSYSIGSLHSDLISLTHFSKFLSFKSVSTPKQINKQIFEEFDYYLHSLKSKITKEKLSKETIKNYYKGVKGLCDFCRQEGWLDVNTYWFKNRTKFLTPKQVEYIPEEVWQQLDECLNHLPEELQRMVIIIRATGLRIGELLNLPLNCFRQRGKQWRLRFLTEKYQIEDELPICKELVAVIQEQQEYIKQQFGDSYRNLFGSYVSRYYVPKPRIMKSETFNRQLNKLATKYNICTKDGLQWHFRSHQFRKTVATVMTNAGVRDLIIQKYLRHRSPDMQNYYKHLLQKVIGEEYQQLIKETKYVDSTGKIITNHKPKNPITELMRKKMYQITTQYGECHRPILKSPCQTVNACWSCEYWLTSSDDLEALKQDLRRVEAELEIAENLGMVRQKKGLASDQKNLVIRIQGLEEN